MQLLGKFFTPQPPNINHRAVDCCTCTDPKMDFLAELENSFFEPKSVSPVTVLLTLIVLVAGFFYYHRFSASALTGKKLPPGSLGFPLVGESFSLARALKNDKSNEWMQKHIKKFGPIFKTSLFGSKTVVLTGQAGNRFLFGGGDNGFSFKQPKNIASVLGKYSLFELSGSEHKIFRNAIVGFLQPESLQRFVGEMDSLVQQQLSKELDGKDSVKIVPLMKKIAFKVTCSILFGVPDGEEKDILLEEFSTCVKGSWAIPVDFPGTVFHRAMKARANLCKRLSKIIRDRKRRVEEGTVDGPEDIIMSFLKLRDENGEPFPEEEILDMVLSLIMASHDTTTILMSLFIRFMSRDAELHKKVLEEQMEVSKAKRGSDGRFTWNDLQMMKYTWRVEQELLRFYPPLFANYRHVTRDITFDGYDIPKGWRLMWVASGTHMDENIFEDPEKFNPLRFESSAKAYPPYTYIPFGAGPRICPGVEFARVQSLLVIHHFVTKYWWTEMIPDERIIRDPLPYPAKGIPVKLYQRNNTV